MSFKKLFPQSTALIGMIHVRALPGTPGYSGNITEILESALNEAAIYKQAGWDGIIIENMHDIPYLKREVGPEITAMMTLIGHEIKRTTQLPCGIQILAGANKAALAAAKAANMDFIRAEGFVFAHVADEGILESDAGELLRYRKQIDAEHILILTDIKKKHSAHAITSDVDIIETAKAAQFFKSDGLIITGSATGQSANLEEVKAVRAQCNLPVLIGSGINLKSASNFGTHSDALIVGSWLKEGGYWANPLDKDRVKKLREAISD